VPFYSENHTLIYRSREATLIIVVPIHL